MKMGGQLRLLVRWLQDRGSWKGFATLSKPTLLYVLAFLSATIHISISIMRPLWMDEVFSVEFARSGNPVHAVRLLMDGWDTQAPLYYGVLSLVVQLVGSENIIALRCSSVLVFLTSCVVLRLLLKEWEVLDAYPLVLFLWSITGTFTYFIAVELRVYSLYLLLVLATVYMRVVWIRTGKIWVGITYTTVCTLFLYSHYIALYYVVPILLLDAWKSWQQRSIRFTLPILISVALFSLWIPSILAQWTRFEGLVYHDSWGIKQLAAWLWSQLRSLSVPIIVLFLMSVIASSRRKSFKIGERLMHETLLVFALMPLVFALMSNLHLTAVYDRYLIPSLVAIILLAVRWIYESRTSLRQLIIAGLVVVGIVLSFHRSIVFVGLVNDDWKQIRMWKQLAERHPLVCESMFSYMTTYYYVRGVANASVYYPLDLERKAWTDRDRKGRFADRLMISAREALGYTTVVNWQTAAALDTFHIHNVEMYRTIERHFLSNPQLHIVQIDSAYLLAAHWNKEMASDAAIRNLR